jgi:hypothetical protein
MEAKCLYFVRYLEFKEDVRGGEKFRLAEASPSFPARGAQFET